MFKVEIKTNNTLTHTATFETTELCNQWINSIESNTINPWGKLERLIPTTECTPEELAVSLEVIPELSETIPATEFSPEYVNIISPEMQRLPKTYIVEIIDLSLIPPTQEELREQKIIAGKLAREACEKVLDLIAGYNLDRELTIEQITQLQATFTNAEAALRAGRPTLAKIYIQAIVPDEVLVTPSMKSDALVLLQGY